MDFDKGKTGKYNQDWKFVLFALCVASACSGVLGLVLMACGTIR